jgi:alpha-tubulin suppressor-like RCC1 family protein
MYSQLAALAAMADRRTGRRPSATRSSRPRSSRSLGLSLVPVISLILACSEPTPPATPPPYPQPLVITPATQTIQVPRTIQALVTGGNGAISWASSDESVAGVSESGLVTARFPGDVVITVRRGSQSATLSLTVTAARLDVGPRPASVALNGTYPLTAIVRDADGAVLDGVDVRWSTANASIAAVHFLTGVVTGIAPGYAVITAVGGGTADSITVTVGTPDNPFARIAFSTISTIQNYSCGLEAETGRAYCWGDNHSGALGIGEVDGSDTPVVVSAGRRFKSLSVGDYGNCAVEAGTGSAFCWGWNGFGNIGDGTLTTRWFPTLVQGEGLRFTSVSTSGELSCGVEDETGAGYCWGREGGIGDGTVSGRLVPTLVRSAGEPIRFSSISVGGHACGVEAETGRGFCWGPNESGQLGDGTRVPRLTPTLVAGGAVRFSSISPGGAFTCGVEAETGFAYCWGANAFGQLGDGTTTARSEPTPMSGSALRFTAISARGDLACGIEAETGGAYCWGRGYTGTARLVPTPVAGEPIRFSNLGVGGIVCGIEAPTGRAYCWGDSLTPTPLSPIAFVASAVKR